MKTFFWKQFILPEDQPDNIIWKRINQDEKVDQAEIETLYEDAKKAAPAKSATAADVPTGPTLKSAFTGDEMKLLQFGLSQCPKVDKIMKAVLDPKGNEGLVT